MPDPTPPTDKAEEVFVLNGTAITARSLAVARQVLALGSPLNAGIYRAFHELTDQEQRLAILDARNYLLAVTAIAPTDKRDAIEVLTTAYRQPEGTNLLQLATEALNLAYREIGDAADCIRGLTPSMHKALTELGHAKDAINRAKNAMQAQRG